MANTYDDQQIKDLYAKQLAAQTEKINADYLDADKKIEEEKLKAQKLTDENLNRTAVEAQKAAMNREEMYNAYGLSSGAKAQARLASENQTRSDMATLRQQLQDTEAAAERERTLLSEQYANAIRQAQQQNDLALAQALYDAAQQEEDRIREDQRIANQNAWEAEQKQLDREHQAAQNQAGWEFSATEAQKDREHQAAQNQAGWEFSATEAQKDREHQATQSQNQYNWQTAENEKNRTYDQEKQEKEDQKEKEEADFLRKLEAALTIAEETGDYSLYAQLAGLTETPVAPGGGEVIVGDLPEKVKYNDLSQTAKDFVSSLPYASNGQSTQWKYTVYDKLNALIVSGKISNEDALSVVEYLGIDKSWKRG